MANILSNIADWFNRGVTPKVGNLYNRTTFQYIGGQAAQYDYNNATYLEKGFGQNPDVYSIITQQANKVKSIPFYIKRIKDKEAKNSIDRLQTATKGNYSVEQMVRKKLMESKAFAEKEMPFPLDEPNPNQTWTEIFALYQVYLKTTGNVYFYMVAPENGNNAGKPSEVYILPSHLVKIVLKENADMMDSESVISHYMLIQGDQFIEFQENDVIHIKYPNPFFDFNGSHLYGLSPIKAALRNLESSNDAVDHNVKTMKNSGVFGFISSSDKDAPFGADHAAQVKETLQEMKDSKKALSNISAVSVPIHFTRLSLDTNELQQFEYLKHDQKALCNVLGWSDKLLNNDEGAKYDNVKEERKRVITDTITPDLVLLADAFNKDFIKRFPGYEDAVIEWDVTELPEMQEDMEKLAKWMENAPVTKNEYRSAIKFGTMDLDGMDVVWIDAGKKRIDDVGITDAELEKAFRVD